VPHSILDNASIALDIAKEVLFLVVSAIIAIFVFVDRQ
jgi:hypothetical protein